MIISRVSKRGQVVIPKRIREISNLNPGDTIKFSFKNNQIIIEKIELTTDDSMIQLLKRGKPFKKGLVANLRSEWE